ncbi:hypothetical protein L873DRAFT_1718695 [Choiromyces venosus 120613-1]|uniref:LYC1 C-terminal domain-containing protein n=1 Tax=Choiromyces venosus 120613-1 TaxID=1336337 RepID=A0A3N4IWQ0_9PEZI|nr:hypothetical protein L873DRAFT_1718695 [Choiromyces venosus 120613-1]
MSSTSRHLRNPTPQELVQIRSEHQACWGKDLTLKQYLKREEILASTALTVNGGLTNWVLVDPTTSPATILASCESIQKKVFVVDAGSSKVRVSYGHSIGSVFAPVEMRGKGHASAMLKMLAEELRTYGGESALSALYSDIGKEFYKKLGWYPHTSFHLNISVHLCSSPHPTTNTTPLKASSLPPLCTQDIKALKASLTSSIPASKTRISFHPDPKTFDWHFARAEYLASITNRPPPTTKGAITTSGSAWIIWNHDFQKAEPKLCVLRIAGEPSKEEAKDLLAAALTEAREWGLSHVQAWNLPAAVEEAGKEFGGKVVEMDMNWIPSVMMYGPGGAVCEEVEWFANEKFAWC